MSTSSYCQACGACVPRRALGGLCPRCVGRRLLVAPSAALTGSASSDDATGLKLGHYHLAHKLGEGGSGIVYLAEQDEPVRRRVALKILKPGLDTRAVVARFEAERQALAMMDHPNIARVIDAGATEVGRPYFVMELVQGIRLTDYCERHQLGTEARLELFISVCQAVQHAHQKGVIHRDLKPSNILVATHEGKPVAKVIDFGIAKAIEQRLTEATLVTEQHQILGTPAYMSPEQLERGGWDLDTRSDIYSLGVVLYELLTGRTPFDPGVLGAGSPDELRRMIREVVPLRPSKQVERSRKLDANPPACSAIAAEVDWIVMKCLEKDRTRRYETANALAQDVRRHLADEPVSAAAPTFGYRFGKFARRNKAPLVVGAFLVIVLMIATGVSLRQAARAASAERVARQRLVESESAREEAESMAKFLTGILQSPDPSHAGRAVTVVETLDRTAQKIESDPGLPAARRAKLEATLGATYRGLGHFQEAIPLLERVLEYHRTADGSQHPATLEAMRDLAVAYHDATRHRDALNLCQQIVDTRQRLNGPEHPLTLLALSHLAWSRHANREIKEAIQLEEEVLKVSRRVNGPEHDDTIKAMSYLGWFYGTAKRDQDALPLQARTLALIRQRLGPEHPDTLNAMTALAVSQDRTGHSDEAIQLLQQTIVLSQKIKGATHPETLWAMGTLADRYRLNGRWDDALRAYEEIFTLSRQANGDDHGRTRWAKRKISEVRAKAGRAQSPTNDE